MTTPRDDVQAAMDAIVRLSGNWLDYVKTSKLR